MIHLRRFLIVFILLSFCGTSSAQQGPNLPPKFVDGIMAVIGEKIIRRSDFETEKMDMARGQILKDSHLLYCLLFEKLIVQKLMLNQAEIDSLPVTNDRIESDIDNRIRYFQRQVGRVAELEKYIGKTI